MKYSETLKFITIEILDLISRVILVLKRIISKMSNHHLLVYIADGLAKLLQRYHQSLGPLVRTAAPETNLETAPTILAPVRIPEDNEMDWMSGPLGGFSLGSCDFLSSQDLQCGLKPWPSDLQLQENSNEI